MRISLPLVLCLLACSKHAPPSVYQEVIDQGATRYFGKAQVSSTSTDGNVESYTFSTASGPECLTGGQFSATVRDTGSDDLFIFLQGGGACWSSFCLAVTVAPPGVPTIDILNQSLPSNPLANTSVVYVPYCDGSLFVGDSELTYTASSPPQQLIQHGLQNLSAALDIAYKRFPNPKRIILAGSSGGGYGSIIATILVRARYPSQPILVFEDSGLGLGNPDDPSEIQTILTQFNATSLIPQSCGDCLSSGSITPLVAWELARDPQLSVSAFDSYGDYVISQVYLQIPEATFENTLLTQSGAINTAYPTRYKRFLIDGQMHTTLLGGTQGAIGLLGGDQNITSVLLPPNFLQTGLTNIELGGIDTTIVNGVSIATWFGAMLNGSDQWTDTLQEPMSTARVDAGPGDAGSGL